MADLTRRFLWGIIVVLLITNLTTLLIWVNAKEQNKPLTLSLNTSNDTEEDQAAIIGEEEITIDDWMKKLKGDYGQKVLRDLINKEVVLQLAEKHNLAVNEKLINRELALMETMLGIVDNQVLEEKRENWEDDILYQFYLEELLTRDVGVDEEELQAYYEKNKSRYEFQETYQLSQILIKSNEDIQRVQDELEEGASFSMLAREYSDDLYTKEQGGYLGYYSEDSDYLQTIYYDIAKQLREGEVSSAFPTREGNVLLLLHRKLPAISFQYNDLKNQMRREIALSYLGNNVSVEQLWNLVGVEWLYSDN